jgi:hypothetical protein
MAGTALLKHTWKTTITNDTGAATLGDSVVIVGSNEFNEKITVPAGGTAEIDCGSLAYAKMKSLFLVMDQPGEINTNAADATGGQTIALEANKAVAWNSGMPMANPITANITKIFVTNSSSKDATFRAGFLLDLLV